MGDFVTVFGETGWLEGSGGYSKWFVDGFFNIMDQHSFEEACGMISRQGRDMIVQHHQERLSQEQVVYMKMLDL